jgi:D-alanyl-D-alanine carboxypeptidase/D-alanyl-D-alanine-endopeptidase (penicillin-binding protein 4)
VKGRLAAALAIALVTGSASARPATIRARPAQKAIASKAAGKPAVARPTGARPAAAAKPAAIKPGKLAAAKPTAAAPRREAAAVAVHDGAHARVAINHLGDLRPGRDVIGRREEPLSPEEDTARQIEKLLRGPLRRGVTGLFVADARTGEALFAVNADDPLNPASNVKMISTATALELLGPDFKYPTRLLGATPEAGAVHGDVYLLGSYDPTLTLADLDDLAARVAARGVTRIDGTIVVGPDPTRDGVYRAVIPVEVRAGEPGGPAIATPPAGMDLVIVKVAARTGKAPARPRLTYKLDPATDAAGHPRVLLTIGGTIGKGGAATYPIVARDRTATAAYALRSALRAHGVAIDGDFRTAELADFVSGEVAHGSLPVELGRHESARLAEIVAHVNKWSINWLADRVVMTAAALARREPPSMELALSAMYDWLVRRPRIAKDDLVVDTGSGLSYRTRITAHELVSIVRSAAGFAPDADAAQSHAWLDSLSIAGTDGTLSHRFRSGDVRGRIRGKTGTLATAIALSGVLDFDPQRPLAFSLVTNATTPLSKGYVRRAHEQVVALLCRYLARTQKARPADAAAPSIAAPAPTPTPTPSPAASPSFAEPGELDDLESEPTLDLESIPPR